MLLVYPLVHVVLEVLVLQSLLRIQPHQVVLVVRQVRVVLGVRRSQRWSLKNLQVFLVVLVGHLLRHLLLRRRLRGLLVVLLLLLVRLVLLLHHVLVLLGLPLVLVRLGVLLLVP